MKMKEGFLRSNPKCAEPSSQGFKTRDARLGETKRASGEADQPRAAVAGLSTVPRVTCRQGNGQAGPSPTTDYREWARRPQHAPREAHRGRETRLPRLRGLSCTDPGFRSQGQ